jgi:cytochrome c peroxidase
LLCAAVAAHSELPPVPVPPENPVTEDKRILGKILFWDEQLSSDDSVACGTCHRPAAGGADPRTGVHPGSRPGTGDDVHGSPGIRWLDSAGHAREHPLFGTAPQVTPRTAPAIMNALWSAELFWDGRATSEFTDPLTGKVLIAEGGALESQAVSTLMSGAEMAKQGRQWPELTAKLARIKPLALASDWPSDVARALATAADYPALFAQAFGDRAITPARIAFAIASYERTLVPDQTPWDEFMAGGEQRLSASQRAGWEAFESLRCVNCHAPPLFTNHEFFNIGLHPDVIDVGRQRVTRRDEDRGDMRVPGLRNVGLKRRLMHTGEFRNVLEAINFYNAPPATAHRDEIPGAGTYSFSLDPATIANLTDFLVNALTDPRVATERSPFDRPRLNSERTADSR